MIEVWIFLQKSSVAYKPPCECFQTGFQHCVLYPKEFCNCSASCTFVKDYLQGDNHDQTEIISMRTYSGLITPIPPEYIEGEDASPGEQNSAKLLNSQLQVLFGVDFFPSDDDEEVGGSKSLQCSLGLRILWFQEMFGFSGTYCIPLWRNIHTITEVLVIKKMCNKFPIYSRFFESECPFMRGVQVLQLFVILLPLTNIPNTFWLQM